MVFSRLGLALHQNVVFDGVVVIRIPSLHSAELKLWFPAGSNLALGVSRASDGDIVRQTVPLQIRIYKI